MKSVHMQRHSAVSVQHYYSTVIVSNSTEGTFYAKSRKRNWLIYMQWMYVHQCVCALRALKMRFTHFWNILSHALLA